MNRVLELVPLARIVLVDLEAAVAGSLQEAPLSLDDDDDEEKEEKNEEEVEAMDVQEEAAAGPAAPVPMEQDTKEAPAPAPAAVEEVVVVDSQDDATPEGEAEALAKPEPHPRVPAKWDAAEFARVAAWVLALPLPPFLDEADMERAAVKKAFAKLQVRASVRPCVDIVVFCA